MTSAERMREWRAKNPTRSKEINRKSRRRNYSKWAGKINAAKRNLYRKTYLPRTYGITEADYDALIVKQNGRCAICRTDNPQTKWHKRWSVDHDHETGKVRGLLCFRCNVAIGHLRDDPLLVRAALEYLLTA